jgi:hypothetical protein
MALTFCIDNIIDGKPYPNAAIWEARPYTPEWRQFSTNWPYSEPVHFFEYLDSNVIDYKFVPWTRATKQTLYPISISYFDFDVDWFAIIPLIIREKLRSKSMTIWFFYSEADNPQKIQQHLEQLAAKHEVPMECVQFTSANSSADSIPGFHYFADDECLYQLRNIDTPIEFHTRPRSKKFTALVRTHKWWRAATMARIWSQDYHNQGYFSYNNDLATGEHWRESPVRILNFVGLFDKINNFLSQCPFNADSLNSQQHNSYALTVKEHFEDSYLNVILETHLDCDQSNGVFLTEKTFKPIKHSQPFIIFGAVGTIARLQQMGYRTFDHVINHSYDSVEDNTQRWDMACREFERLMSVDLHQMYIDCQQDLQHNQQLFLAPKVDRLNTLLERTQQYATIGKQLY